MHKSKKFEIISFYEFINLRSLEQLKFNFYEFLKQRNFRGTIIIAKEGVNGTISCKFGKSQEFQVFLEKILKKKTNLKIVSKVSCHNSIEVIIDRVLRINFAVGKNN